LSFVEQGVIVMAERSELTGSFEDGYAACFVVAYRAAYRVTGVPSDAEDIAQEAMIRAYARWNQIRDHVEPWVTRVATNLALDGVRRRRLGFRLPSRQPEHSAVDARLDLARAIARLPKRQREAVALRFIADLAEVDVARLMGCSAGSVKQHASRGLASLRTSGHLEVEES
jgi:RNA polymerase sigma-70 factor, ECF subfamily